MSKHAAILQGDLLEHLAVRVWNQLQPERVEPESIEILKKRRKSTVYRLKGVGPDGAAVIAKRSWLAKALVERTIHEEILPHVPIPALSYYGFVVEEGGEHGWLFLADAVGEEYSPYIAAHRALTARWLGLIHTSAVGVAAAARLPDRGPDYYLECLRSAHDKILRNLTNPALTADDLTVLKTVVGQCEVVVSHWSQIEQLCARLPRTLIHGDFAPKNMRVRTGRAPLALLPFDWGSAGWGSIAPDLVQSGISANNFWASPDLAVYCSMVRESWPYLDVQDIQPLAIFGKMFRCLVCINLDAESLGTEWVEKCMWNMRSYAAEMADAIQAAEEVG
jgi:hypothetical protein